MLQRRTKKCLNLKNKKIKNTGRDDKSIAKSIIKMQNYILTCLKDHPKT